MKCEKMCYYYSIIHEILFMLGSETFEQKGAEYNEHETSLKTGLERTKQLFETIGLGLGITPEKEKGKRTTLDSAKALISATTAAFVLSNAIPETAHAKVQMIPVQGDKIEQRAEKGSEEVFVKIEILSGTSVLTIQGLSDALPSEMPKRLTNAPLKGKDAVGSSFLLVSQRQEKLDGKKSIVARYETEKQKPIKENEVVLIPTNVASDRDAVLRIATNEDQGLSFGRFEAQYQFPIGDRNASITSEGLAARATVKYPLTEDDAVSLELGAAFAIEHGKPGTFVQSPPAEGKTQGFKVGLPSLGIAYRPFSKTELRGVFEPSITEAPFTLSKKRPAVLLGSWKQKSDDPNWWQYQITAAAEVGDDKAVSAFIPRAQAGIVFDKAFVNTDSETGIVIGAGAKYSYIAGAPGKSSASAFQIPLRFGVIQSIPNTPFECGITTSIAPGRDNLPELGVEVIVQEKK